MFLGVSSDWTRFGRRGAAVFAAWAAVAPLAIFGALTAWGDDVPTKKKQTIGATAKITETTSGFVYPARVDTGAQSCSLHVEKIEIKDPEEKRLRNVGKSVRIHLKDPNGETKWIDSTIAKAIRVKSSTLKSGEYDHRYKVKLTLKWKDFEKDVLVTLNDRTDMDYPLLIGRNYLRGDFVVDVDQKD